jgi:SAM-dependent methyltransferase
VNPEWLDQSFDEFPRVEEAFHDALEESLQPRGPDFLYELVAGFALPPGSRAVDVGCGEGKHTARLSSQFGFDVTGFDPVARHIELARSAHPRVRFELGRAESLPLDDESIDLVWCRDVLILVPDLDRVYEGFARVLRPGGRALVYQMFAGEHLEPREAAELWRLLGGERTSADPAVTERAIRAAGLLVDALVVLGSEWGEHAEEAEGKPGKRLLWAARLLRDPGRYVAQFGRANYEIMLGDCLWHVYAMIGKLERRVYVLRRPAYS